MKLKRSTVPDSMVITLDPLTTFISVDVNPPKITTAMTIIKKYYQYCKSDLKIISTEYCHKFPHNRN